MRCEGGGRRPSLAHANGTPFHFGTYDCPGAGVPVSSRQIDDDLRRASERLSEPGRPGPSE